MTETITMTMTTIAVVLWAAIIGVGFAFWLRWQFEFLKVEVQLLREDIARLEEKR